MNPVENFGGWIEGKQHITSYDDRFCHIPFHFNKKTNCCRMNQKEISLSALIIAKDEERCIKRCISSLGVFDEIIVVDTGSVDCTINIVKKMAMIDERIKYFHLDWCSDFSRIRNFARDKATKEWLFFIDADEYLDKDNSFSLKYKISSVDNPVISDDIVICPRIIDHDGTVTETVRRIFKRNSSIYFFGRVHEEARCKGGKETPLFITMDINLLHDGYSTDVVLSKDKVNRNLTLLSEMLKEEPDNMRWVFFYCRDGIGITDNLTIINLIKSSILLNPSLEIKKEHIILSEYTYGLLDILLSLTFNINNLGVCFQLCTVIDEIYPVNNITRFYLEIIRFIDLKKEIALQLDRFVDYRQKWDASGRIKNNDIDSIIAILLFENGRYESAFKYFSYFDDIGYSNSLLTVCKNRLEELKLHKVKL